MKNTAPISHKNKLSGFLGFTFVALIFVNLFSCKKEEKKSSEAELLTFSITNTVNLDLLEAVIDHDKKQIILFSKTTLTSANFPIIVSANLTISPKASVFPLSGQNITITNKEDGIEYKIIAEDGRTITSYMLTVADNQIPNSSFENWHQEIGMNSKPFSNPGKDQFTTVWATANMGTSTYGKYGTTALIENGNTLVQIKTGSAGLIPITGGTLFLGKFDVDGAISNPTDPAKATDFGIPFVYKPTSISLKYKYQPGDTLKQGVLKNPKSLFGGFNISILEGSDEFSIAVRLEKRVGNQVTIIGENKIISSDIISTLTDLTIPINYVSSETPTHFYVVFASSAYGDKFKGAVGSTLVIDDLKLNYE